MQTQQASRFDKEMSDVFRNYPLDNSPPKSLKKEGDIFTLPRNKKGEELICHYSLVAPSEYPSIFKNAEKTILEEGVTQKFSTAEEVVEFVEQKLRKRTYCADPIMRRRSFSSVT